MKSRLVILDADIIIYAHEHQLWRQITSQYEVYVTSIVLQDEAAYFTNTAERPVAIDLKSQSEQGIIHELTVDPSDIASLLAKAKESFLNTIDPGEIEALALLFSGNYPEYKFCTADTAAMKAMAVFEVGNQAISLEKLLRDIGNNACKFNRGYTEEKLKKSLADGHILKNIALK